MRVIIDTDACVLKTDTESLPLYGESAYRIVSQIWLQLGWNADHYAGFSWLGRQIVQLPHDVLRLAEAVWSVRPSLIIETGTYEGGTACLFASLCRLMGQGRVISIDKEQRPEVRERLSGYPITFLSGDSTVEYTIRAVHDDVSAADAVFAFLDSDHSAAHVLAELEAYAPLITSGSYIVVADTNLADLADLPKGSSGWSDDNPAQSVHSFLRRHPEFRLYAPPGLHGYDAGTTYFREGWLQRT